MAKKMSGKTNGIYTQVELDAIQSVYDSLDGRAREEVRKYCIVACQAFGNGSLDDLVQRFDEHGFMVDKGSPLTTPKAREAKAKQIYSQFKSDLKKSQLEAQNPGVPYADIDDATKAAWQLPTCYRLSFSGTRGRRADNRSEQDKLAADGLAFLLDK